jgi:hypothetical protein
MTCPAMAFSGLYVGTGPDERLVSDASLTQRDADGVCGLGLESFSLRPAHGWPGLRSLRSGPRSRAARRARPRSRPVSGSCRVVHAWDAVSGGGPTGWSSDSVEGGAHVSRQAYPVSLGGGKRPASD